MKKQWISAILMLIAGTGIFMAADTYPSQPRHSAILETEAFIEMPTPQPEHAKAETTPIATEEKTEEIFQPIPEELNLAHFFPEEEDPNDISKSYAPKAFITLMTHDAQWYDSIYGYADLTPEQFASQTGQPKSKVIGSYNPNDNLHDPDNPDSWIIHSFRNIRTNATNGDGQPISVYSNVIEIMSAANVYCYYKDAGDYDLFLSYAMALWKKSHSYSLSMSDIYYCEGCLNEEEEKAHLNQEAMVSSEQDSDMGQTPSTQTSSEGESTSEASVPGESVLESSALGGSVAEASAPEGSVTEASAPEGSVAEASALEGSVAEASALKDSVAEASAPETGTAQGSSAMSKTQNSSDAAEARNGENSQPTKSPEIPAETGDFADSGTMKEATPANSGNFDAISGQESADKENANCPGHVDLIVQMKILGIKEKNGLFRADPIGNQSDNFEENRWQGWTPEAVDSVKRLASQDWYQKYGLTVSSISMRNPLSGSEIEEYINRLPEGISQTRKEIIRFALSSVGRVPYYWGGKASAPDYSGNNFGFPTAPDERGRILKGLDCSGWINWVYWSVTGNRLPYESTSGLALCGTAVNRDNLQPGDIILRTGDDAHVIMFLEWTEDGKIRCIHESSANVNNVTVAVRDANWPYYRKLIE